MKRGHYTAARVLLHRACAHAAACDHPEAEARALLLEARNEASVCNYAGAIQLIQKAQALGGAQLCAHAFITSIIIIIIIASHRPVSGLQERTPSMQLLLWAASLVPSGVSGGSKLRRNNVRKSTRITKAGWIETGWQEAQT
jgi:hypothetical protein